MKWMNHFSEQNFYEVLEVSPEATSEEIQKAFFRAKSTYSPNSAALYSVFSEAEAQELLKMIDEAYGVLSNPSKRRDYDKKLFGKTSEQTLSSADSSSTSRNELSDLPDFMLPQTEVAPTYNISLNSKATPAFVSSTNSTPAAAALTNAKSVGRTIMSHYNVDEKFEEEIKAQEIFDGGFLQRVRHYRNVTIDQLSESSRISRPYLIAVETNDYSSLPAAVYVRGFISAIAKFLNLPEKKVVDSYMTLLKQARGN